MSLKGTVHHHTDGEIAVLVIDNPPVNALSSGVRQGLHDHLDVALADAAIKAIIVTGSGNNFIAGADISEFSGQMEGAPLPVVLNKMEKSNKPIIAAINGAALGGGLETALCCDYRVTQADALFGLPEVKLGLLPGAGGTQRLPRLIGADATLNIMLTAQHVSAAKAAELGMVDRVIDSDLLAGAKAFASDILKQPSPTRKIRDMTNHTLTDRQHPEIFSQARQLASKIAKGQDAPEWIIQCVEAAVNLDDFDQGLAKEAENFFRCFRSPQRKALIHVFFNERNAAKIPDIPKDTPKRSIETAAVIGAGTMGGGIAMCFANAGIPVKLLDASQEALDKGLGVIRKNYEYSASKGKLSAAALEQRLSLIEPTLDYDELNMADIIVEAVFENMTIKKEIFARLDTLAKPGAILATNTSALDIDEIAAATQRPGDVIGTHFFSPANVMPLLEVVRGKHSGKDVIATVMSLGKHLKKVSVLSGNCHGFIGNRMIFRYMEQASKLVLEGALPQQVDQALQDFGLSMGPFAMHDLVGLDLSWRERKKSGVSRSIDKVADALCEAGRYGQKNGVGYYRYATGERTPLPDPAVKDIVEQVSQSLGVERREISDEEIVKRCLYALINEGAKILKEGIAIRSSDIDIVYIYGYGFPAYRGGPMFYADTIGCTTLVKELRELETRFGPEWTPAELLIELAECDGKLSKWQPTLS